jgi:hypothetical protein
MIALRMLMLSNGLTVVLNAMYSTPPAGAKSAWSFSLVTACLRTWAGGSLVSQQTEALPFSARLAAVARSSLPSWMKTSLR